MSNNIIIIMSSAAVVVLFGLYLVPGALDTTLPLTELPLTGFSPHSPLVLVLRASNPQLVLSFLLSRMPQANLPVVAMILTCIT